MKCNGYDFDKTIYAGDCTLDFYRFCIKKHSKCLLSLPKAFLFFLLHLFKIVDKTRFKQEFYAFLRYVPNVETIVQEFVPGCIPKIKKWYLEQQQPNDIVISASPEFIVCAICREIGISHVIASKVDFKTGQCFTQNCHGEEKVRRFYTVYPDVELAKFYSDSTSDLPMARKAETSYLVHKNKIKSWRS